MKHASYTPLLWRVCAFAGVFTIISTWLGWAIIHGGIIYQYHFNVYGSMGKALLFALFAFALQVYRRVTLVQLAPWRTQNVLWLAATAGSLLAGLVGVHQLAAGNYSVWWLLLAHGALLTSVACAAIGCFGSENLRMFARTFKKELLVSLALAVAFTLFMLALYAIWPLLSGAVLYAVHWLLALGGLSSEIVQPRTLLLDRVGVEIAQYCSGIESIALFTGLYVVVGIIDWQRFDHKRYIGALLPALAVLFMCNILRVLLLVLVAYYISKDLAFNLFHTYVGMIFFIIYSAIFWKLAYRWMLKRNNSSKPPVS